MKWIRQSLHFLSMIGRYIVYFLRYKQFRGNNLNNMSNLNLYFDVADFCGEAFDYNKISLLQASASVHSSGSKLISKDKRIQKLDVNGTTTFNTIESNKYYSCRFFGDNVWSDFLIWVTGSGLINANTLLVDVVSQSASPTLDGRYWLRSETVTSASRAISALSASYAPVAGLTTGGTYTITSSWAVSSSYADYTPLANFSYTSGTASEADLAKTASYVAGGNVKGTVESASYAISASHEIIIEVSSSHADRADSASYADVSLTSSHALWAEGATMAIDANNASFATSAGNADTAINATSASYAKTSSISITSITSSAALHLIVSESIIPVIDGAFNLGASDYAFDYVYGNNLIGNASTADNSTSASYAKSASFTTTSSYALNTTSASYAFSSSYAWAANQANYADTAGFASSTWYADSCSISQTASFALNVNNISSSHALNADMAITAAFAQNFIMPAPAPTSSYASSAFSASHAERADSAYLSTILSGSVYLPTSASITFVTTSIYNQSGVEGRVFWDSEDNTLAICNSPNVTQQVGQEVLIRVCAKEYIPNGSVLYATTESFYNPVKNTSRQVVGLAIADGTSLRSTICGMATEDIASGSRGFMTMIGDIHDVNTDACVLGSPIYLSTTTSGSFTSTRPSPPYEQIYIGVVTRKSATDGIITVNISNPSLLSFISNAGMTLVPVISSSNAILYVYGGGTVNLYNNAQGSDTVKNYFVPHYTGSIPNTGSTYYLVANYNDGSPVYDVLTSNDTINQTTIANVATIVRPIYKPHTIEILKHDQFGYALPNKLNKRFIRTERFAHETGLVLGESGSRAVTITAGTMWFGAEAITASAVNSQAVGTMRFFRTWPASSTGWSSSVVTQYNNTQYDNGAGALVTLSGAGTQYAVNFIFRSLANDDTDLYNVLGRGNYSLIQAQAAQPPSSLPAMLSPSAGLSTLVGRIIVAQDAVTSTQIDSTWATNFAASQTQDHNALSNLQGGTSGEYYHLTSDEYTTLQSGTASFARTASFLTQNRTYQITSSWAEKATTASFALNGGGGGTTLYTGSTYQITSSWSNNTVSASYFSQSIYFPTVINNTFPYWLNNTLTTSSVITISGTTVSIAGTTITTASIATSASYSPVEPTYSASVSTFISTKQNTLTNTLYTITASLATSASYAPIEPVASASISTQLGTKQPTLTNTLYTISASNAITASGEIVGTSYKLIGNYYTSSGTASYTLVANDDGRMMVFTTSSNVIVNTTLPSGFNCSFYQSSSGKVILTGGTATVRNRSSQSGSAGQYAVMSLFRFASGDFVLAGDTA